MKKIDINKSLIFGSTVEDVKNALEYLDQKGYFSNSKDFSEYKEAELDLVEVSNIANFMFSSYKFLHDGFRYSFSYFIPKSAAVFIEEEPEKKTLRPFKSMKEFFDTTSFNISEIVHIKRFTDCSYEEKTILNGFRIYTDDECHEINVIFGSGSRTLNELFKYYKYLKNGKWLPFGVEE